MALKSAPLFELISNAIKEDGKSFVSKVNGVIQVRAVRKCQQTDTSKLALLAVVLV